MDWPALILAIVAALVGLGVLYGVAWFIVAMRMVNAARRGVVPRL